MKILVAFVACLIFAAVLADEEEWKQKMRAAHNKCQEDQSTAVDSDAFKDFKKSKGQGPAPTNLGHHYLCMSKILGWQNADGSINKTHLREVIIGFVHDATKVEDILTQCTAHQENDFATAKHLFKCFIHDEHHD